MKNACVAVWIGFTALAFCARGQDKNQPVSAYPSVTAGVVDKGPVVDGSLDDPCWSQGGVISNFSACGANACVPAQQFRLLTDGQWLYLGGEILHPKPGEIKPGCLDHDGFINMDDSIEWFIDPGSQGGLYYHFMVNAGNVRAEQRAAKGVMDRGWNGVWRSGAKVTAKGWVVEAAIPMSMLASSGDLGRARMNVCVTRVLPVIDPQGVRVGETRESLTWSPVKGGFHAPEEFGFIMGLGGVKAVAVYMPRLDGVTLSRYGIRGTGLQFGVQVKVRNENAISGTAEVVVEDQPLAGKGATIVLAVQQAGQGVVETNVVVPVGDVGDRWVRVALKVAGEEWERLSFRDVAGLRAMRAYLDRNYYTTEEKARAIAEFGLPDETLKGKILKVIGEKGDVLGEAPAAVGKAGFELKGLKEGASKLAIELVEGDGRMICRQAVACVKRLPKPGFEWKNDQENRVQLRDGKPFFARGINMAFGGITNMEAGLHEMKEAGFNAIMFDGYPTDPTNTACLDMAGKYDLLVVPWMESYCEPRTNYYGNLVNLKCDLVIEGRKFAHLTREEKTRYYTDEFHCQLPRFLDAARRIKDHPGFMAYFIFDEPRDKRSFDQISSGHECYRALVEADGYHPVMVNYSSTIPEGDEYVDWCDILATDPYWIPPASAGAGRHASLNWVSKVTANTWRRADVNRNPIWIVLMAEYWSACYKRVIAPQEQFCQTYLALIHGAKGLLYFTFPLRNQFAVDALKVLNGQMSVLGPIVLASSIRQTVTCTPGEFDPDRDIYPDVQAALFRNPEGGFVLLAANSRPWPVEATFTISNLGEEEVRQLFAHWSEKADGSSFKDQLEPYGVRAYQYAGARETKEPVNVEVAMRSHPEAAAIEMVIPVTGRPGKKNLAQNPGFELATLPGAPDYYAIGGHNHNGPRTGRPGAWFELDQSRPFEGKQCLKVRCDMPTRGNGFRFSLAPKCDKPAPFVFSAWMRADRDGVQASFQGLGSGKKVTLTREWKRYSQSGEILPGAGRYHQFGVLCEGEFTVWVDAVQVEQGTEPTDYEP